MRATSELTAEQKLAWTDELQVQDQNLAYVTSDQRKWRREYKAQRKAAALAARDAVLKICERQQGRMPQ